MTHRFVGLTFFGLLLSCGPQAARTPLANAEPEGYDTYFYGDASRGGKELEEKEQPETAKKATKKAVAKKDVKVPEIDRSLVDPPKKLEQPQAGEKADRPLADLVGDYRGTDTVTIRMEGAKERVEQDDNAKLVVKKGDDGALVFKIVDSQNGGDLCSVRGTLNGERVEFEPGQTCLNQILGLEMKAVLKSGSATLNQGELVVDYAIEIEFDGPQGAIEGQIDYHFEGTRE